MEEVAINKPKCDLIGIDGNVFCLMGKVSRTLKQHKLYDQATAFIKEVSQSSSYNEALVIMGKYVDIQ